MYDENDFSAIAKFLKLGVKISFSNPMGQKPLFQTSFPNPKGGTISISEASLYEVERKLRVLLKNDNPVKTKLTPFAFLGTNFRGVLYCTRGSNEYVLLESHDVFGVETNRVVRQADHFIQLLE